LFILEHSNHKNWLYIIDYGHPEVYTLKIRVQAYRS